MRLFFEKYRELILYVFFGGLTTLVDWVSYGLMRDLLHMPYMTAAFLSQMFSILFAYVTNRRFVFESRVHGAKAVAAEMAKFFGARGASLLLNMLVMYVGVDILNINDKVIKVIASVLVIIANYIFSRTFRTFPAIPAMRARSAGRAAGRELPFSGWRAFCAW